MLEDVKFDLQTVDFRALTPEQWSTLKNRLIQQAREHRNADIRAGAAKVLAAPEWLRRALLRAFLRGRRAWLLSRRRRAAFAALSALDDRSLRDIGLRRGEIFSAVYRPQSGRPR